MAEIKRCVVLTTEDKEYIAETIGLCNEVASKFEEYSTGNIFATILEETGYDGENFIIPEIIEL